MSLVETLQSISPRQGILFAAIENLTSKEDIRRFYSEYLPYLKAHEKSHLVKHDPEAAARRNIAYCLSYYHPNISQLWIEALPKLANVFEEINTPTVQEIIHNLNEKINEKKS